MPLPQLFLTGWQRSSSWLGASSNLMRVCSKHLSYERNARWQASATALYQAGGQQVGEIFRGIEEMRKGIKQWRKDVSRRSNSNSDLDNALSKLDAAEQMLRGIPIQPTDLEEAVEGAMVRLDLAEKELRRVGGIVESTDPTACPCL